MSKLYPTNPIESVSVGDVLIEANDDGSFDFPEELAESLHRTHVGGVQTWETEAERYSRIVSAEIARRSDPAALYDQIAGMRADQAAAVVKLTSTELREAAKALIDEADEADKAEKDEAIAVEKAEKEKAAAAAKAEKDAATAASAAAKVAAAEAKAPAKAKA